MRLPKIKTRWINILLAVIIVTWLSKAFIFSVYYVPTKSMSPTIRAGSYVFILKFPYQFRSPTHWPLTNISVPHFSVEGTGNVNHGDVIVFKGPISNKDSVGWLSRRNLIKRSIGLSGDTVQVFLYHTSINGKQIDTRQNFMLNMSSDTLVKEVIVPQKNTPSYFVMGDNRTQSFDSRFFGLVPHSDLIGRAEIKIWPWPPKWL